MNLLMWSFLYLKKEGMVMCIFCDIANKKLESNVVYEDDVVIAFLDNDPINEGHILVVPKIHKSTIEEIPLLVLTETMNVLQKISAALKKVYSAEGYSIMQNGGNCCDYEHFHMHVFPRFENDGFGWKDSDRPSDYSEVVAEKLRKA